MKKNIKYIATALLLVLAASCNKTDVIKVSEEGLISFSAQTGTKATIDDNDGLKSQTFAVVGVMPKAADNFQNKIAYAGSGWSYTSPSTAKYYWDTDPSASAHKFYGYTDGAGSLSNNKLSIENVLTTADTKQTDLLYSDVFSSTYADWKTNHGMQDNVPLHFHHLFSAVSLMLKNCTASDIVINSVSVAVPNNGSASVDYSGNSPVVEYGDVTVDGTTAFISNPATDVTVAADAFMDVFKQAVATEKTFMVVWPQTFEDTPITVNVNYTTGTGETTASVTLPGDGWLQEHKYEYTLGIYPTDIQLILEVQPWDDVEKEIAYGPEAVANALALEYASGAAITSGSGRRINNYFATATDPIHAYFSVYAPLGTTESPAQWRIKVTGDTASLLVSADNATSETVDGVLQLTGKVGGRVHFIINRAADATITDATQIQLSFYVVLDGREININSEITRGGALTITGQVKE